MPRELPGQLRALAAGQSGVLSRAQLIRGGFSDEAIEANLRARRWQRRYAGIYVTFSGLPPRLSQVWAGLLAAGPAAVLSHETAAELWGLTDEPTVGVHVSVPLACQVRIRGGLKVHRTVRLHDADADADAELSPSRLVLPHSPERDRADARLRTGTEARRRNGPDNRELAARSYRHPTATPPRTRVEVTVIDLAEAAGSFAQVVAWVTRACQRRLTTPGHLRMEAAGRARLRWRKPILGLLVDVADGADTPLELAYLRKVERPHRLPTARRQRHEYVGGRSQWVDADYVEYGVRVELDGRIGHVEEGRFRDHARDNASVEAGHSTLRYGWGSVQDDPCAVAAQVARQLTRRGWAGRLRGCGPTCPVQNARAA